MAKAENPSIHKYISNDLSFRASLVNGTRVVQEMQSLQNTYPLATNAVGRAMVGALLMASHLKDNQMVSIYFKGDGPLEMFFAEATYEGAVRGYTPNPQLVLGEGDDPLNLSKGIGKGTLSVVRTLPNQVVPQRGSVEIHSGEVAEDLAYYYHQSHQVPSVVGLGVKVNPYGMVLAAGGVLIELMPGSKDDIIKVLEQNAKWAGSLSELLGAGAGLKDLADLFFRGLEVTQVEHPFEAQYSCRCTKDKFRNALSLLGPLDIADMISKKEVADARCELCGRHYQLTEEELQQVYDELKAKASH